MTPEERQALREKHHIDWDALYGSMTMCVECYELYPCDVIKVLDATEPVSETDPKSSKCDHLQGFTDQGIVGDEWIAFTYCPKCGEKL